MNSISARKTVGEKRRQREQRPLSSALSTANFEVEFRNPINTASDSIAGLQRADTRRRPGENQKAGLDHNRLRDMADDVRYGPDHIAEITCLPCLAIDRQPDGTAI